MCYKANKRSITHFLFLGSIGDLLISEKYFKREIKKLKLNKGSHFTVYIKFRSGDNFAMAGNQFGWIYKKPIDISYLYQMILPRITMQLDSYSLDFEDITYIQITFRSLDPRLNFPNKHLHYKPALRGYT